ncbi:MAG: hypothetical protein ABH864_04610 [archaeon]
MLISRFRQNTYREQLQLEKDEDLQFLISDYEDWATNRMRGIDSKIHKYFDYGPRRRYEIAKQILSQRQQEKSLIRQVA